MRDPSVQSAIDELRREAEAARAAILSRSTISIRPRSEEEIERAIRRAEAERRAAAVVTARQGARLPPGYAHARLEDVEALPTDATERYLAAAESLRKMLRRDRAQPMIVALIGVIGAGKTYLAAGLVNAMVGEGRTARYTTAFDYCLAVRRTFGGAGDQAEVEREHIHPELLVLDEMQIRGETPHEELLLLRLLDKRYHHQRATLLLSNHKDSAQFRARIDARIWDRMRDGGGVRVVDWPSLRGRTIQGRREDPATRDTPVNAAAHPGACPDAAEI